MDREAIKNMVIAEALKLGGKFCSIVYKMSGLVIRYSMKDVRFDG